MPCRIFIENPPPFKKAQRKYAEQPVDIIIDEGVETVSYYLDQDLKISGFHHSDLDRYEADQVHDSILGTRYDTFQYVQRVHQTLPKFPGLLIPHKVVVYNTPPQQEESFRHLALSGIKDVILVGKPYSAHPQGLTYRASVEEMLAYLREHLSEFSLNLGVIGIHTRRGEAVRIANKFEAAGGRLRVMGQFLDEAETMKAFLNQLAETFAKRHLDLTRLEWNIGLAVFALKNRRFYTKLLRKERLACERRFEKLNSAEKRIAESVRMNLAFAEQVKEAGEALGLDIGFSIQPIVERKPDGTLHPAVEGAARLARELAAL